MAQPSMINQLTILQPKDSGGGVYSPAVQLIRGFRWLLLLREEEDDDDFVGGDGDGAENENDDVVTKS